MKLNIQLFAGSCSIQSINETTDIDTNQSTFTIAARLSRSGTTHNNDNAYMTLQWKYASDSSWTSLSKQTFTLPTSVNYRERTWTLTLTHNDDGSLANVQFRVKWYITDSTNGTTGATTFTPTTIPRASQPTLSTTTPTMGSAFTIYTNRVSDTFTHTIRYWFGNANGTIAQNVTTSTSWTPSLDLANQIPSATSGVGTIYCDTYQSGNLIGTKTINFTLNVPSSVVPSVSFTNVSEAGDVPSSWGVYVKNKSRIALAISGSGAYSSSIASYVISYYGGSITTSSGTTSYLTQAGNTTFTAQVTDTRGRGASTTTTINVVDYYNPTISTAQVQRCDENGNIDNNGEYMYISYGASISPVSNKNTPSAVYKVGYRVQNTGDYTYVTLTTNANSYSASGMLFTDGIKAASSSGTKVEFSSSNTFDIQFYVRDYFMEYTNVQTLDTGFDLMNFNPSGKAMAIGKVSEAGANEELLEIGMNTDIDGNLSVSGHTTLVSGITSAGTIQTSGNMGANSIELSAPTPFIDFHFNNSASDYTSRIIENSSGVLTMQNSLDIDGNLNTDGAISQSGDLILYHANSLKYLILSATGETVQGSGIYFRPNGTWQGAGQMQLYANGNLDVSADVKANGNLVAIKSLRGFNTPSTWSAWTDYTTTIYASQFNYGGAVGAVLIVVGAWSASTTDQSSIYLLSWSGGTMEYSALKTIVSGGTSCSISARANDSITLSMSGSFYNMISLI